MSPASKEAGFFIFLMFHIIWYIIVGFIVGLIARGLVPGAQEMGFFATSLFGIVGSVIGGLLGGLFNKPAAGAKFHPAGFFVSILGSIILLLIVIHFHA